MAPYSQVHPSNGHVLTFVNNVHANQGLPTIAKINPDDFHEAKDWFTPKHDTIIAIANTDTQTLPTQDSNTTVSSPKIIPIPKFLVPLFIHCGSPQNILETYQIFQTKFYSKITNAALATNTKYIQDFLLVASGHDATPDNGVGHHASQLAIDLTIVTLDAIIVQWANNQFGGMWHIAAMPDTHLAQCTTAATTTQTPHKSYQRHTEHPTQHKYPHE